MSNLCASKALNIHRKYLGFETCFELLIDSAHDDALDHFGVFIAQNELDHPILLGLKA